MGKFLLFSILLIPCHCYMQFSMKDMAVTVCHFSGRLLYDLWKEEGSGSIRRKMLRYNGHPCWCFQEGQSRVGCGRGRVGGMLLAPAFR